MSPVAGQDIEVGFNAFFDAKSLGVESFARVALLRGFA